MERKIIAYKNYYKIFFDSLTDDVQEKILHVLLMLKTQERLSTKFVKHIREGIYKLRIEYESNIYRIFFCFDEGFVVILFNGFQKKTQNIPLKEINKAIELKNEYYERKKEQ
jgi:phage-related protein